MSDRASVSPSESPVLSTWGNTAHTGYTCQYKQVRILDMEKTVKMLHHVTEVYHNMTLQGLCNNWLYSALENSISQQQHSTQNIIVQHIVSCLFTLGVHVIREVWRVHCTTKQVLVTVSYSLWTWMAKVDQPAVQVTSKIILLRK